MTVTKTHFAYRIDRGDADGNSIMENHHRLNRCLEPLSPTKSAKDSGHYADAANIKAPA
jgi:hypothetical protein